MVYNTTYLKYSENHTHRTEAAWWGQGGRRGGERGPCLDCDRGKASTEGQQNKVLKNQGVPHRPPWQSKELAQRLELGRAWVWRMRQAGGQIRSEGLEVPPKGGTKFVGP